ncbi:uncharacterized protein JCM6883_006256 [Sporobolomyces salmoneus]|uniref:uncharacterized protein n=1 Tax=Sporobolomyces salmoneus TaxID=183962 RepID=UPI00317277F3
MSTHSHSRRSSSASSISISIRQPLSSNLPTSSHQPQAPSFTQPAARTRTPSLERGSYGGNGPKIIRQSASSLSSTTGATGGAEEEKRRPVSPIAIRPPSSTSTSTVFPSIGLASPTAAAAARRETGGGGGGGGGGNGPVITRISSVMGEPPTLGAPVRQATLPTTTTTREEEEEVVTRGHERYQTSESIKTASWNGGFTPKASQDPLIIHSHQQQRSTSTPTPLPLPQPSQTAPRSESRQEPPEIRVSHPFTRPSLLPSSVPLLDSSTSKPLLRHSLHQGRTRFFCRGRLLTSRDNLLPFIASLFVAFGLPGLWLGVVGRGLIRHYGRGKGGAVVGVFCYLTMISWSSMLKAALTDPGILPRNLDPDPQRKYEPPIVHADVDGRGDEEGEGKFVAEVKYVRVKNGVVGSKWCETCEIYRPPRTSHCRICDNCVELTDHHCAFLNNCIARRNYLPFLTFLSSTSLLLLYSLAFTSYYISLAPSILGPARWDSIISYVLLVGLVAVGVPVGGLGVYHTRLVLRNSTTIEMLRPKSSRGGLDPATGEPLTDLWKTHNRGGNCFVVWGRPGIGVGGRGGWRELARRDGRIGADADADGEDIMRGKEGV